MKNLANSNPKRFWKKVRKLRSKQNHAHHISKDTLTEHFQEVSNDTSNDGITEWQTYEDTINIAELDKRIDPSEVYRSYQILK